MREKLETVLQSFTPDKSKLIPMLQAVQDELGYLPEAGMRAIARYTGVSESKVYGVATFYAQFHLKPRGKNIIRVCRGTACHVRGVSKVADKLQETLKVGLNETTEDKKFTYEEVACIGACGLAPVMMINDRTYGKLSPDKIKGILKDFN